MLSFYGINTHWYIPFVFLALSITLMCMSTCPLLLTNINIIVFEKKKVSIQLGFLSLYFLGFDLAKCSFLWPASSLSIFVHCHHMGHAPRLSHKPP